METYTVKIDEYKTINWYQNDKRHRVDGPAVESASGEKNWYSNGKRHRTDGPAVEYADGTKFWYSNGECHRIDGPAIEFPHGGKRWLLNGKDLTEEEFNKQTKVANCAGKVVMIDGKKYALVEVA